MIVFAAFGFFTVAACAPEVPYERPKINAACIEQYLKEINFLADRFVFSEVDEKVDCSEEVEKFKKASIESVSKDLSNEMVACIESGFKFFKTQEYLMKAFVYQSSEKNNKEISKDYSSALHDLDKITETIKHKMCLTNSSSFSTFFDSIYNSFDQSPKKDFCLQKFVVDNHYKAEQDFDSSPDASKFSNVNCDILIAKLRRTVNKALEQHFTFVLNQNQIHKQCVKDKMERSESFDNYAIAAVLKQSNVSVAEKAEDKKTFVKVLVLLFRQIMECGEIRSDWIKLSYH